ncbi:VOC family protein [Croceicoccus mobilis]|uniref:Glyoxalase n=1 Tax=Croceicoccus mobilis TaxID=1703339 RepID=A0A917DWA2_9SPHN|nr:VOC family protein [Croceicoccus mobilis]GGD77554.1 glyoxalase [Croceicoccus mobilis]
MTVSIFVNLPVADLDRAVAFYEALGFEKNPMFSDETAASVKLNDAISVMLLTHAKWQGFTTRPICPPGSSEVSLALTCPSRDAVDAMVEAGAAHGGSADVNPPEDHGFMYQRTILDPYGHVWEPFWMDMSAIPDTTPRSADEGPQG